MMRDNQRQGTRVAIIQFGSCGAIVSRVDDREIDM